MWIVPLGLNLPGAINTTRHELTETLFITFVG